MARSTKVDLPATLAQRVQVLREQLGITTTRLAERALLPVELIQDVESGIELFLSPAIRMKLARALRVKPHILQDVEKPGPEHNKSFHALDPRLYKLKEAFYRMVDNPDAVEACPQCGNALVLQRFERKDLQDQPITHYKLHCSGCLLRYQAEA